MCGCASVKKLQEASVSLNFVKFYGMKLHFSFQEVVYFFVFPRKTSAKSVLKTCVAAPVRRNCSRRQWKKEDCGTVYTARLTTAALFVIKLDLESARHAECYILS